MDEDALAQLNEHQRAAVTHTDGPSIILAGAGSGKTRVLTYKVLYLIEKKGIDPSRIAMMTFTNKAAQEMKLRVKKDLGFTGTFHSLGAKLLRHYAKYAGLDFNFVIYDEDDAESLIKQIMKSNPPQFLRKITPKSVKYRISGAKDNLLTPSQLKIFADDEYSLYMTQLYGEYQKRLEKNNAVDFDDLIFKIVKMCQEHENIRKKYAEMFDYVLVDEFQDTNSGQYAMAKYLAGEKGNITVVGDFAQSIYSWRGADIRNLTRFEEDFENVHVFHLEQNYRSTQNVLDFAYDVIVENGGHPVLKLFTDNAEGEEVAIMQLMNEEAEAVYIAEEIKKRLHEFTYDDFAVLYRMNAQSRVIEEVFLHYGMPYVLIGGTRFYERKEIKDILAYVRLTVNPDDEVSQERAIKIGKQRYKKLVTLIQTLREEETTYSTERLIEKILEETGYVGLYDPDDPEDGPRLENIKELRSVAQQFSDVNSFLEQIALVESEYSENERHKKGRHGVKLMTMHQAKGLEFPFVFIVGLEEGILPHSRSIFDKQSLEEERRLLYVGITRAKKKLFLTYAERRRMFGRGGYTQVSRFIQDKVGGGVHAGSTEDDMF